MTNKTFHWPAVLVAALAGMFIGFLWYGLFFNTQWSEAVGFTGPGLTEMGGDVFRYGEPVVLDPVTPMIINVIGMIAFALIFSWLVAKTGMTTWINGATIGLIVGLVPVIAQFLSNMFAMTPSSLSFIDGSYYLVLFTVIGAVVGGWRKRVTS